MRRINRYARDGSVLSLLPNPLTRVDLTPPSRPGSSSAGNAGPRPTAPNDRNPRPGPNR